VGSSAPDADLRRLTFGQVTGVCSLSFSEAVNAWLPHLEYNGSEEAADRVDLGASAQWAPGASSKKRGGRMETILFASIVVPDPGVLTERGRGRCSFFTLG
jgi:hypothetical protein